jgi:adenosylhomocysteinase
MDMTFALQAMSLKYVCENREYLQNQVYNVPEEIDRQVALMKLDTLNINIDTLTKEQNIYLSEWRLD